MQNRWATSAAQISDILTASNGDNDNDGDGSRLLLPENERPVPYDAVAPESMDDQKYVQTIYTYIYIDINTYTTT